ncbi:hypothetical protein PM082_015679 [Marasmius tenuissimus]|nr:hypothetical protein PM082_015679 [Marasmius tenuissimus]
MALSSWLIAAATLATHAHAYFLMGANNPLTTERIDPIVNPGRVAGHVHTDYLFDSKAGVTTAFPDDFRMLSGDPTLRTYDPKSYAQQAITFLCLDFNGVTSRHNELPRGKRCPSGIRAQVNFPMCWDGKNVDSPDHKSHVAFPSGGPDSGKCEDPKFPVTLPRVFMEMYWSTPDFKDSWGDAMDGEQPFVFANGDPTGYGYHGDFFNGWDKGVLQKAVDTCYCDPNGSLDCCAQQGVFTLNKDKKCRITKEVDETTTGTLPKLPGTNPVTKEASFAPADTTQPQILEPVYVYYGDEPDKVGVPVSGGQNNNGEQGNSNGNGQTQTQTSAGATEATSTTSQGSGSTSPPPAGSQSGGNGNAGQGVNNGASGGGYGSGSSGAPSTPPAGSQSGQDSSNNNGGYGSESGEVLTQNPPTTPPAQQGTNNGGSGAYGNEDAGVGDDDSQAGHANSNNNSDSKTCGRKSKRAAGSKKRSFHRRRHEFESNQF